MRLTERIVVLSSSLSGAGVDHALGGALALAWCTPVARGTADIDVNIFLPVNRAEQGLAALPVGVEVTDDDRERIARDGQTRLWWDRTPVDVFFDTTDFHLEVSGRIHRKEFEGATLPFLSCHDLAVFKAFLNRSKDWVDLEEMVAGGLDVRPVIGELVMLLGGDDPRIARLRDLGGPTGLGTPTSIGR